MKKLYDGNVLLMTALVATLVGDVVVFAGSIGMAQTDGEIGDAISVDTVGVYEFTGANADVIAVGDAIYWDATAGEATTVSTANTLMGTAWSTKPATTDGVVEVKIG